MTLHELNLLPAEQLSQKLFKCCGSTAWVQRMLPFFPADDMVEILEDAEEQWYLCTEADWKEAFSNHPKIGDTVSLKEEFTDTAEWAANEQTGVDEASSEVKEALAKANVLYQQKFGFIFIVCATGKSANEMLQIINLRIQNEPDAEIQVAAEEQVKIMQLRIQKLLQ